MKHWWHKWNYHRKHLRTCRICHRHEEYDDHLLMWSRMTCKEYNATLDMWKKWENEHNFEVSKDCKYPGTREIPPKPWPIFIERDSNQCPRPREEMPTKIPGRPLKKVVPPPIPEEGLHEEIPPGPIPEPKPKPLPNYDVGPNPPTYRKRQPLASYCTNCGRVDDSYCHLCYDVRLKGWIQIGENPISDKPPTPKQPIGMCLADSQECHATSWPAPCEGCSRNIPKGASPGPGAQDGVPVTSGNGRDS